MKNKNSYRRAVLITALLLFVRHIFSQQIGIWVIRDQLTSQEKIDDFINFAFQNNIKHIFVQVRGRGDAFYHSAIVPRSELIPKNNWDPLQYTIEKAKIYGLTVHAWLNVYLVWSGNKKPIDPNHIINRFPEWSAVDANGVKDVERPFEEFSKIGTEGIYLSPLVPEVKKHILKVVEELVANYKVDGVHFDYIRYPNKNYDYNVIGREIFKRHYGIDPIFFAFNNKDVLHTLKDYNIESYIERWGDFRREAINDLIRETKKILSTRDPSIYFSAAVKPDPEEARYYFFQDWERWLLENQIDFVVLMNYHKNEKQFENCLKNINQKILKKKVWVGIGVYNHTPLETLGKMVITYRNAYPNIVFFSYETFQKDKSYYPIIGDALKRGK